MVTTMVMMTKLKPNLQSPDGLVHLRLDQPDFHPGDCMWTLCEWPLRGIRDRNEKYSSDQLAPTNRGLVTCVECWAWSGRGRCG